MKPTKYEMNKYNLKSTVLDWRWLKILLPLWIIFGGIPLIIMGRQSLTTCLCIFAVTLIPALAATVFCIRCFIFYLKDIDKQKQELEAIEKELAQLEKDERPMCEG